MNRAAGDPVPDAAEPPGGAAAPAQDLADVWRMLDVLPRAESSIDMAATTVDMVAVAVDRGGYPAAAPGASLGARRWFLPAAAVATSLVAGVVAGRVTAPDPDLRILENLPLIRHVGMLEEAGSVRFLQALATGNHPPPPRLPPEIAQQESREFDAAIRDLEADHAWGGDAARLVAERRAALVTASPQQRDALERGVTAFLAMTSGQRRDLAAVATALADPRRTQLRDAARTWHMLIAATNPPDRRDIVELDADARLEWLDRRQQRIRDWDRGERRGPPPGGPGQPPPDGVPRGPEGPGGRPRWPGGRGEGGPQGGRGRGGEGGPRGDGAGRGGPRVNEPRPAPAPAPAETPSQPPRGAD
jgi:hypothetical protein